jgi:hypothetical protein
MKLINLKRIFTIAVVSELMLLGYLIGILYPMKTLISLWLLPLVFILAYVSDRMSKKIDKRQECKEITN